MNQYQKDIKKTLQRCHHLWPVSVALRWMVWFSENENLVVSIWYQCVPFFFGNPQLSLDDEAIIPYSGKVLKSVQLISDTWWVGPKNSTSFIEAVENSSVPVDSVYRFWHKLSSLSQKSSVIFNINAFVNTLIDILDISEDKSCTSSVLVWALGLNWIIKVKTREVLQSFLMFFNIDGAFYGTSISTWVIDEIFVQEQNLCMFKM